MPNDPPGKSYASRLPASDLNQLFFYKLPDEKVPEYGSSEHLKLGGGRTHFGEPVRFLDPKKENR